jgi:hypothetical protein
MIQKIKDFLEFASTQGLRLPGAYDAEKQGPSVSLLFSHVANAIAVLGIGLSINKDVLSGTVLAMIYSVLMLVFYLMRRIKSFKADLDDKSISLDSGEDK